tara:strand:+ start:3148 stop:3273 length:126 start_codon:yes stop_codon:yes gene_type:complete
MKLTKSKLKQIIKEEMETIFSEGLTDEEEKELKSLEKKKHD